MILLKYLAFPWYISFRESLLWYHALESQTQYQSSIHPLLTHHAMSSINLQTPIIYPSVVFFSIRIVPINGIILVTLLLGWYAAVIRTCLINGRWGLMGITDWQVCSFFSGTASKQHSYPSSGAVILLVEDNLDRAVIRLGAPPPPSCHLHAGHLDVMQSLSS